MNSDTTRKRDRNGDVMKKKRNIIWFLIDGVRNYPCPYDPEKLGKTPNFGSIIDFRGHINTAVDKAEIENGLMI